MKKVLLALPILLLGCIIAAAQDKPTMVDSIAYRPAAVSDAALEGKSIFSVMGKEAPGTTIGQDPSIVTAMNAHISYNRKKKLGGYRVRIYFDNKQNSRGASEAAMRRFQSAFPGYSAYRSFTSPNFKVTVGDFRTKSEALQMLQQVRGMFPGSIIVKEVINYPAADRLNPYVTDTVQVSRTSAR